MLTKNEEIQMFYDFLQSLEKGSYLSLILGGLEDKIEDEVMDDLAFNIVETLETKQEEIDKLESINERLYKELNAKQKTIDGLSRVLNYVETVEKKELLETIELLKKGE